MVDTYRPSIVRSEQYIFVRTGTQKQNTKPKEAFYQGRDAHALKRL